MDERRPDDKPAGSAGGDLPDAAPTEQFTPIPAAPPVPPPAPSLMISRTVTLNRSAISESVSPRRTL